MTGGSLGRILGKWLTPGEGAALPESPCASNDAFSVQPEAPKADCVSASVLDGLRDIMGEDMPGLIELFFRATTDLIAELNQALDANDPLRLHRAAHTLKSSCANMGAVALAKLASDLEAMGKAGGLPAKSVLERFRNEYVRVEAALTHYCPAGITQSKRA